MMDENNNTKDKDSRRFNIRGSVFTAFMIAAVAIVWLASGIIRDQTNALFEEEKPTNLIQKKQLPTVSTRVILAEDKHPEIVIRGGKIEAERTVTVRSEIGGKVVTTAAKREGSVVKKGDVLCGIAIDNRQAEKEEAEALMRLRTLQLGAAEKLARQGHNTRMSLAQSRANYNTAQAMLERSKLALNNTKIVAPFDGILEKIFVDEGDFMNTGASCAKVIDTFPLVISGQVTEKEIIKIELNSTGWVELPNGDRLNGNVRYIAYSADPKTRTYRIELEAEAKSDESQKTIRDGLTVEIHIPLKIVRAHRINPSILTLDAKGQIGLRIIIQRNNKNIVQFKPVKIIAGQSRHYWITGLPERTEIITVGQEYVRDGVEVIVKPMGDNLAQPKTEVESN